MIFPGPDSAIFYLDPAAGLDSSNRWIDSSKYQLNVTPVGYAAPNYGLSLGPSGAPRITFNGANQYGILPTRFYNVMPTTQMTVACVARFSAPAANDRIFSARNIAGTTGMEMFHNAANAERLTASGFPTGGVSDSADIPLSQRSRVIVMATNSLATLVYAWADGVQRSVGATGGVATWVSGGDVPCIGSYSSPPPNLLFDGDLYFLGIWPLVFTDSEARAFSAFWMDRI